MALRLRRALRDGTSLMYTSPLIVDGVLYGLSPRLVAFALNAATGEELWRYDADLGQTHQRGLMWCEWGADRRLFYTAGHHLIALDPSSGRPVPSFGDNGALDLMPEGRSGPLTVTVPGIVFEDLIILGFTTSEDRNALPGSISAYSAIDGSLVWRFHSIPSPDDLAANPTSATRRGFRRKSRILAPRPTRCASETGGFRVRGLPEPRVVPTYPLD